MWWDRGWVLTENADRNHLPRPESLKHERRPTVRRVEIPRGPGTVVAPMKLDLALYPIAESVSRKCGEQVRD